MRVRARKVQTALLPGGARCLLEQREDTKKVHLKVFNVHSAVLLENLRRRVIHFGAQRDHA